MEVLKMAKYIYPAIFAKEGDFYTVRFPDLESCYTQGDNLQDAYEMASDVLCLTLYNLEEEKASIPPASETPTIKTEKDEFVSLVACDTLEYRQYYDNRAVKKTLTIPAWLNTMSEREGINFSAVLQAALKSKLNITGR
jgi:antitoxin HicB